MRQPTAAPRTPIGKDGDSNFVSPWKRNAKRKEKKRRRIKRKEDSRRIAYQVLMQAILRHMCVSGLGRSSALRNVKSTIG
jgi:hypothetical protein